MNTKQKIIDKYVELVLKKKTPDISVTELCEEVGISRMTFYRYFHDRYTILEDLFIEEIENPLRISMNVKTSTEYYTRLVYYSFLKKKDFYCIVIKEEGANSLYENIIERLVKINKELLPQFGFSDAEIEYFAYKNSAMQALLIRKWMREGMKESPEFMAKIYSTSILNY